MAKLRIAAYILIQGGKAKPDINFYYYIILTKTYGFASLQMI